MKQTNQNRKENPRAQSAPKRLTEGTTHEIGIKKGEKKREKQQQKDTYLMKQQDKKFSKNRTKENKK